MGQKKMSFLVSCLHFRGLNEGKSGTHGRKRCSVLKRGVLSSGLSL